MSAIALSQRLRSSGLWAACGRVSAGLMLLAVHGVLARALSSDAYGRYVLIESLALLTAVVCMCGLPTVTLRLMRSRLASGDSDAAAGHIAAVALRLIALISIVTLLVMLLGAQWSRLPGGLDQSVLPWFVAWAALAAGLRLVGEVYRAYDRYAAGYTIGGQSGGLLLNASLLFACFVLAMNQRLNLTTALTVQVVLQISILVAALHHLRADLVMPVSGTARSLTRILLLAGGPILIQQLVSIGLPEAGKLFLGEYARPQDAGRYNSAFRLVLLGHVPLMIVNNAIQPFVTELHASGKMRQLQTLVRGAATLAALPAVAVLVTFVACPEFILTLAFGADFASAASTLQWLALGSLFWVLSGSCGLVLMMTGHERACMLGTIVPGVGYLIAAPWLIQKHGSAGAAMAAAMLHLSSNLICVALVYRHHRMVTIVTLSPATVRDCIRLITGGRDRKEVS